MCFGINLLIVIILICYNIFLIQQITALQLNTTVHTSNTQWLSHKHTASKIKKIRHWKKKKKHAKKLNRAPKLYRIVWICNQ